MLQICNSNVTLTHASSIEDTVDLCMYYVTQNG